MDDENNYNDIEDEVEKLLDVDDNAFCASLSSRHNGILSRKGNNNKGNDNGSNNNGKGNVNGGDNNNNDNDDDDVETSLRRSRSERSDVLSEILFVYAKEHPAMGYRQGMHEILSYCYLVLEIDIYREESRRRRHQRQLRLQQRQQQQQQEEKEEEQDKEPRTVATGNDTKDVVVLGVTSGDGKEKGSSTDVVKEDIYRGTGASGDDHHAVKKNEGDGKGTGKVWR